MGGVFLKHWRVPFHVLIEVQNVVSSVLLRGILFLVFRIRLFGCLMVELLELLKVFMKRLIVVQKGGGRRIVEGEGLVLNRFVVQPEEHVVTVELTAIVLDYLNLVTSCVDFIGGEEVGVRPLLIILC